MCLKYRLPNPTPRDWFRWSAWNLKTCLKQVLNFPGNSVANEPRKGTLIKSKPLNNTVIVLLTFTSMLSTVLGPKGTKINKRKIPALKNLSLITETMNYTTNDDIMYLVAQNLKILWGIRKISSTSSLCQERWLRVWALQVNCLKVIWILLLNLWVVWSGDLTSLWLGFLSCEVIIRVVPTLLGCGDPMTEYIGNVLYLSFTLCVFYVFSHPGAAKKLFQCCQSW